MVLSFREVRRTLPEGTFRLQYEKMLDPDLRLSILSRLIEFIGEQNVISEGICHDYSHLFGALFHIDFTTPM
jgi:hypothetical protein